MPKTSQRQRPSRDLEELRHIAGLSQRSLAFAAGVDPTTVLWAERGRIPAPETQKRIAIALGFALGREITALDLWPLIDEKAATA